MADETTPALRVLRGTPTAEELAALVGVLLRHSTAARRAPGAPPAYPAETPG